MVVGVVSHIFLFILLYTKVKLRKQKRGNVVALLTFLIPKSVDIFIWFEDWGINSRLLDNGNFGYYEINGHIQILMCCNNTCPLYPDLIFYVYNSLLNFMNAVAFIKLSKLLY